MILNDKIKYIANHINQLSKAEKIKILSILIMYQYQHCLKESKDGIRYEPSLIKDEHHIIIFDIIQNNINIRQKK
jgi:hypothetical protein